jgi:hypothetical protein
MCLIGKNWHLPKHIVGAYRNASEARNTTPPDPSKRPIGFVTHEDKKDSPKRAKRKM